MAASMTRGGIRRWARWAVWAVIVVAFVLAESTTRGYVRDGEGHPLAGADIVLADSATVVMATRTDGEGYFRLVHRPFARPRYSLLICARGNTVYHLRQASSALLRSEYTIGNYTGRFPNTPASLGWHAAAPPSCPSAPVTPAG